MERFFHLVVFNYFVHNGDAHLKNFSLIRNDHYGDYTLTPAYDLLNTRLHVPNETRTALNLFRDDEFETDSFKANAFYAFDDFRELALRLGLRETRFRRIMQAFIDGESAVFSLIDRSGLPEECKQLYKEHVRDSIKVLALSGLPCLPEFTVPELEGGSPSSCRDPTGGRSRGPLTGKTAEQSRANCRLGSPGKRSNL